MTQPILPLDSFEDTQTVLNHKFAKYLNGKSVAIVGRAGNLHKMEQGELIDSHDIVVRVHRIVPYRMDYYEEEKQRVKNKSEYIDYEWFHRYSIFDHSFVPEDWHARIGRRTNIYYHRLRKKESVTKEYLRKFEVDGGQFICFNISGKAHYGHVLIGQLADVRYLNIGFYLQIAEQIGDYPLAGTVAIADILRHNVQEAYISGFPCYFDNEVDYVQYRSCRRDLQFLSDLRDTGRVTFDSHMLKLFDKHL